MEKQQVNPGPGYRLLNIGELIEPGDEMYSDEGGWTPRQATIGQSFNGKRISFPTRRKVESSTNEKVNLGPGVGYRFLVEGEKIEKGDEFFAGPNWQPRWATVGHLFHSVMHNPTRRKVEQKSEVNPVLKQPEAPTVAPGNGYRLLSVGEIIQPGDQYFSFGGAWSGVFNHTVGEPVDEHAAPFRRPVGPTPPGFPNGHWFYETDDGRRYRYDGKKWELYGLPGW